MLGITEAEEDGRLELRHVVSPVIVDLPGLTAQDKCVLRAPRFEGGVGAVELVVETDMHGVRRATGRELHALDHVRVGKAFGHGKAYLHAKALEGALVIQRVVVTRFPRISW